jgi:hypothetical protein
MEKVTWLTELLQKHRIASRYQIAQQGLVTVQS